MLLSRPPVQGLYDTLQTHSIESWVRYKPCQVGLMADVLVDALPRSRVAVPLIAAFASAPAVRDALLERHPTILDQFLEKAVNGESEYDSACIAFFASPLPEGFVPPARIATLISRLVSVMVADPCMDSVTPIHALITGLKGSPQVLNDVPSEIMSGLQLEFTKTLRNLDDHMGNLLCLSTFAQITTARLTEQHQHGSERQWLLNIKQFFGPKRGIKTLDLVVLRAILACSSSCNLGPQDAAASIRLAIDISDAIEPAQKQAWIASNSAKVTKLCEKAAKDGLDPGIQKMAVCFLHALLPEQSLSSQLRGLGLRTLFSKDTNETLELISPRLITRLAKSLATTGELATREVMAFVLGTFKNSQWQDGDAISALTLAQLILTGLQELDPETLNFNLSSSMSSIRQVVGEAVESFPRKPNEDQCKELAMCNSQLCIMQNQLFLSLLGLYNTSSTQFTGDIIMKTFMARVVQSLPDIRCAFSTRKPIGNRERLSLPDTRNLSSTHIDRDWRAGFTNAFMQNAQAQHDNMMRKIEETCFDLERRCDDVEGPLRIVEEERDRYALEVQHLREQNEQMVKELLEKTDEVEAARRMSSEHLTESSHEHTRLEQLLQDQYAHRDELMASVDALRMSLNEQKHESEKALLTERDTTRSKELELMATLTGKDDQIEELQEELSDIKSRNEETVQSLALMESDFTDSLERARLLHGQKDDRITELLDLTAQKTREIEDLLEQDRNMQGLCDSLNETLDRKAEEHEEQRVALEQSQTKLRGDIERLNREAANEASRASNEVCFIFPYVAIQTSSRSMLTIPQIAKLHAERERLQSAMQATALNASKDAQVKDKRIHNLERKVQALRDERAAKAREFSEAQQHIGRLMGVMGFSANAPESTKHQRTRSSPFDSPVAKSPRLIGEEKDGACRPSSPAPHRRGNRKSLRSEPIHASPAASPESPRDTILSGRRPLAETGGNGSANRVPSGGWKSSQVDAVPSTPTPASFEENHLRGLNLGMDLEFSKDFQFSGTAFTGSDGQAEEQ
ncbi:unnamed protein product [Penicillium olsonii]|uniref:Uncharacterized protein n=1 Tax=Penicillium olsonii TaxID=99116 RepID=A0A9W4N5B3_PENOL|nr:unnamed protein product [Penicillium olsonii]CAG8298257.1 unnamed protein product [Penicillium olsonii]